MKIEASVNCPFSVQEIERLTRLVENNPLEYIYLGINEFIVINLGQRKYKYGDKPTIEKVLTKVEYIIRNNI